MPSISWTKQKVRTEAMRLLDSALYDLEASGKPLDDGDVSLILRSAASKADSELENRREAAAAIAAQEAEEEAARMAEEKAAEEEAARKAAEEAAALAAEEEARRAAAEAAATAAAEEAAAKQAANEAAAKKADEEAAKALKEEQEMAAREAAAAAAAEEARKALEAAEKAKVDALEAKAKAAAEKQAKADAAAEAKAAAEKAKVEAAKAKAAAKAESKEAKERQKQLAAEQKAVAFEAARSEAALQASKEAGMSPRESPSSAAQISQQRLERAQSRMPKSIASMSINEIAAMGTLAGWGRRGSSEKIDMQKVDMNEEVGDIALMRTGVDGGKGKEKQSTEVEVLQPIDIVDDRTMQIVQNWLKAWRDGGAHLGGNGGIRTAEMRARFGFQADCLGIDEDGDTLVGPGGDGEPKSVSLYSAKDGKVEQSMVGHDDKVMCVAIEGEIVASGSRNVHRLDKQDLNPDLPTVPICPAHLIKLRSTLFR